jgi:hypothetical protein
MVELKVDKFKQGKSNWEKLGRFTSKKILLSYKPSSLVAHILSKSTENWHSTCLALQHLHANVANNARSVKPRPGGLDSREHSRSRSRSGCLNRSRCPFSNCGDFLDSWEQSRSRLRCLDMLRFPFSNCRDFLDSRDVSYLIVEIEISIKISIKIEKSQFLG